MTAADAAMPGSWARVAPFLEKLPALRPGQKAAAVNLGIFPDSGGTAYAYNAAPPRDYASASPTVTGSVTTDRLAAIDELLHQPAAAPAQPSWRPPAPPQATPTPSWQPAPPQPTTLAYNAPVTREQLQPQAGRQFSPHKIWLQLASGQNAEALHGQFERIRSKDRDLFQGITGYVAKSADRARLVIGPFRNAGDAQTFAADLDTIQVNTFQWTNSPTDQIVPLGAE